ncbi:variant leucine-rich repeat-containing protein [Cryobacterium zhongshanensis]|uniref:VWA domain-containing protein n=1 Tax=Cryobacterium zhongshanensis TaxID=2928153 RepID=A0AA41QX39_9MICO|nr:VWA domain-containing protein [Cryobacterium zhongshanensis]MCI4658198.1 VWA domain-containing protein [Cryobacterium zhongshanensis]
MYWSSYDTLLLVTGILTAGIGLLPVTGVPARTRGLALAIGAGVIVMSIITGNMQSFTYPSQVSFGPVLPIIVAVRVLFVAHKARKSSAEDSEAADAAGPRDPSQPLTPAERTASLPEPAAESLLPAIPVVLPQTTEPISEPILERTPAELAADPATPAGDLADLAYAHPELRTAIAANPAAYPELREWIAAAGDQAAPGTAEDSIRAGAAHPSAGPTSSNSRTAAVVAAVLVAVIVLGTGVSFAASGGLTALVANIAQGTFGTGGTDRGPSAAEEAAAAAAAAAADGSGGSDGSNAGSGGVAASPVIATPHYVPTVLILDASGSMIRDAPGGGTRMEAARAAATTFVNGLSDGARLGLTVFGTKTGNADSDQQAGCTDVTTVLPVGAVDKPGFTAAIAGIVQSGFTPIGLALQRAADQLPTGEAATIVLVSDGVDSCSPPPSCDVAATLKTSHPDLTIHTIGFLVDADEEALAQLACIARVGGGEFVEAKNAAQLAARLRVASDPVGTSGSLTSTGIYNLRLGMTLDEARAAEPTLSGTRTVNRYVYLDCPYATLRFANGVVDEIRPQASVATAEGLAPGDTLGAASLLYGDMTDMQSDDLGAYAQYAAKPGGATGYRVFYTPTADSQPSWTVVRIILCTCGPKTAAATSAVAGWVIDFNGIGPIAMGRTIRDAAAILPEIKDALPEYCTFAAALAIPSPTGSLTVASNESDPTRTISLVTMSDDLGGTPTSQLPRTRGGVGFGSTLAEVQAAHPGLSIINFRNTGTDYGIITGANGNSLIFQTDQAGRVTTISVSTGTVPLWELCG